MITPAQIRGARAMIGFSTDALAAAASLSPAIVAEAETGPGPIDESIARILREVLETHGIVFIDAGNDDEHGAGLRLKNKNFVAEDGIRPEYLNAANDD